MPKRKASNGLARAIKRFKRGRRPSKKTVVTKLRRGIRKHNAPLMRRPVSFGNIQPVRVRMRMINYISDNYQNDAISSTHSSDMCTFIINRLRDPQAVQSKQVFPENFVNMARMYKKYLVHGVKVTVYYAGISINENARFISIFYTSAAPAPEYNATGDHEVNAILQEKNVRRRTLVGPTNGEMRHVMHKAGYFACARSIRDPNYYANREDYAGVVGADGTVQSDPAISIYLHHQNLSTEQGGFPGADPMFLRYKLEFDVEWYDRRLTVEGNADEDP